MKPIAIPETTKDRENRDKQEVHTLIDSIFTIYHFYKPDGPRFEATPKGIKR